MYKKGEASKIKEEFWTTFGKYMSPIPSAEGLRINWINYKTGVKDLRFFKDATADEATIGIKFIHADEELQEMFFSELGKYKDVLETYTKEPWQWILHQVEPDGRISSVIQKQHQGVNIFEREQWPEIISFLKPRMIALVEFWNDWKYIFDGLD